MTGAAITPTNITGSFVIPPLTQTGTWTVMVTNTATDKQTAQLVNGFTITSEAAPVSPDVPLNLISTKSGNNAILTWTAPASGEPTGGYRVFRGISPTTITTQIGSDVAAGTHTLTDTGAVTTPDSYYYVVKAFSGSTVSGPSNVAYLIKQHFIYNDPSTNLANKHWVSIPYKTTYASINDILIDINGQASAGVPNGFPITSIVRRNPTTQLYESATYNDVLGWLIDPGPNAAPIVTGEGYEVTVDRTCTVTFAGAHDPNFSFNLAYNGADHGNKHWISIPYMSTYADGQVLVNSVNAGNTVPGTANSIVRWNPTTQQFESVSYNDVLGWLNDPGPNAFPIITGEAFEVTINASTTWKPATSAAH